jgi:hypothetical protein
MLVESSIFGLILESRVIFSFSMGKWLFSNMLGKLILEDLRNAHKYPRGSKMQLHMILVTLVMS